MALAPKSAGRRAIGFLLCHVDESTDAWDRSKQPSHRVRRTRGNRASRTLLAAGNQTELTERQIHNAVGDVQYLAEALAALADLRKLYGLDVSSQNFSLRCTIAERESDGGAR